MCTCVHVLQATELFGMSEHRPVALELKQSVLFWFEILMIPYISLAKSVSLATLDLFEKVLSLIHAQVKVPGEKQFVSIGI